MKAIKMGDAGAAVEDVQRRLRLLGYDIAIDGAFGEATRDAVRAFRASAQLPAGEAIDEGAWSALVDASFVLGDRMLYLRIPYFHGGDVRSLQQILDVLGFIAGGADGIFGAHTESALRDFQASVGLMDDGIAGASTYDAIERLRHAWEGKAPASADDAVEHLGFARAASVLERIEACFFGIDETGRAVASRMANLAWATTPAARVTSAEAMGGVPSPTMLMVGVSAGSARVEDGVPVVEFADDAAFIKRLRTAVNALGQDARRVIVRVPGSGRADDGSPMQSGRWEQHLAVLLLDAFCSAFS